MLRAIFIKTGHEPSSILPYTWIELLQISSIEHPGQLLSLQRFHHIRISGANTHNLVWAFPTWRPFTKLVALGSYRQNSFPNQIS
jgi:hypothetical protein